MLTAVLFDFDGTLVDTTDMIYQGMHHATEEVLGREIPRDTLMANVGQPLASQMEALDPEHAETLLESYRVFHNENHDALIKEFPGVSEALARLSSAGVKIGVVTSKLRASVEMALHRFPALRGSIDQFVAMEDTTEHKPRPAPLLKGLEYLGGVPEEEAVYVGDSPYDIAAAKAAGMRNIAVSWGAFSEDTLRAAEPDHLVPDLDAVVDVLLDMRSAS